MKFNAALYLPASQGIPDVEADGDDVAECLERLGQYLDEHRFQLGSPVDIDLTIHLTKPEAAE